MTPDDLVRQVYYAQTNVRLNFFRTDDKYKEVIEDVNMVLAELQMQQDWSWLRERVILGSTGHGGIPEFVLPPEDIYRVATQRHDCVKLYSSRSHGHKGIFPLRSQVPAGSDYYDDLYSRGKNGESWVSLDATGLPHHGFDYRTGLDETDWIEVPWENAGSTHGHRVKHYTADGRVEVSEYPLTAFFVGNTVTFNRPLRGGELHRMAVTDCIMKLKPLHICDSTCDQDGSKPCEKADQSPLARIPDPLYVVIRSAAMRAELDPVVNPTKLATLVDRAQKLLSGMRENDASATMPEYIEYAPYGYYEVT
jgi:hypothetical protein